MEFTQNIAKGTITASQESCVNAELRKSNLHESDPAPAPGFGKSLGREMDGSPLDAKATKLFQEITGTLTYLFNTRRWDIVEKHDNHLATSRRLFGCLVFIVLLNKR